MSKRMTKVLSLILTLVMFLSITPPAFAWGSGELGPGLDRDIGEDEVRDFELPEDFEEEEEPLDYFQTTNELNGSMVTVEAPMGSLPSLAELRAEPVAVDEIQDAVNSVLNTDANILVAMDISFWLNDVEIEPEEPVRVKISAPELDGKQNLTLVHIPDEAEPETVDLLDEDELSFALGTNEIAFQADSFSVYVIVDGDSGDTVTYRRTYQFTTNGTNEFKFYDKAGELVSQQIVKTGDTLEKVTVPYQASKTFQNWEVHSSTDESIEVGTKVDLPLKNVTVSKDATVVLKPAYGNVYYVSFHAKPLPLDAGDQDVILTKKIVLEGENVTIGDVIAPQYDGTLLFYGWSRNTDGSDPTSVYNADGKLDPDAQFPDAVSADMDLYPNFVKAYWLKFVAGPTGSGARYVPAQFIRADQTLRKLPVTTRPGYTFQGWYTKDYNDDDEFEYKDQITGSDGTVIDSNGLMLNAETVLYAFWKANTDAPYKVIIWRQRVSDDKNALDADKTYDYAEGGIRYGTTDALVSPSNEDVGHSGGKYLGFHYARTVQNYDTIQPDGSTVINVYYDRDMMAFNFYYRNADAPDGAGPAYTYTATTATSGDLYGLKPDGTYVLLKRNTESYTRVYYTYNVGLLETREYIGTFYTRTGFIVYNYTDSGYNGDFLPPDDGITYYTEDLGTIWVWVGLAPVPNIVGHARLTRHTATINGLYFTYEENGKTIIYTGTRYTRGTLNGYKMVTYTGLWGQNFDKYEYEWPADYYWYEAPTGQSTRQTFLNAFTVTNESETAVINPYNLYDRGPIPESTDYTIIHYKQNLDGSYSRDEINVDYFPAKSSSGGTFSFSDKFAGFKVNTYSASFNEEGNGTSARNSNGTPKEDVSVPSPVHIYHTRNKWDIIYMVSTEDQPDVYNEKTDIRKTNVAYETLLGTVDENEVVTSPYDLSLTEAGIPAREGYEFTGWYADQTCTKKFDFSSTMPNANLTLYAGFEAKWYLIQIDPAGGEITNAIGATYMWKQHGTDEKLHRYEIKREYIEDPDGTYIYDNRIYEKVPVGFNGDRTTTYVTSDAIVDDGTRYRKVVSGVDFPYTLVGWYDVDQTTGETTDKVHDFDHKIDGPVWIRAVWILGGDYGLRYNASAEVMVGETPVTVSGTFTQKKPDARYADGAEIVLDDPPTNIQPAGFVFDGWEIVEPTTTEGGQGAVLAPNDGDKYYQPGETLKLDAAKWARNRTIYLRAHYTPVDSSDQAVNVTYLQFKPNFPTTADPRTGVATDVTYYPLNTAIDLKVDAPKYTAAGFKQIGWSQYADATVANGKTIFGMKDVVGVDALTPTETLQYEGKEVAGNVLYAIWAPEYFYIYHSADNTVEKILFTDTDLTDGKINLVDKVAEKAAALKVPLLYGGYFSDYGGKSSGFTVETAAALCENTRSGTDTGVTATGEPVTAYTYDTIKTKLGADTNNTTGLWAYADGYKADGRTLVPEGNVVYYLKEVPDGYLNPYTQYTYYKATSQIGTLWAITAVDELNYKDAGFVITDVKTTASFVKRMTIKAEHSAATVDLEVGEVFASKGVLNGWFGWTTVCGFSTEGDPEAADKTYTIQMFWTTKDGVDVFGNTTRLLETRDGTVKAETGLKVTDTKTNP